MIGNLSEATLAYEHALPILSNEGTGRTVYRVYDVVYKVDKEQGSNAAELTNYNRLCSLPLPAHIGIPMVEAYDIGDEIVIAMEYIDGERIGECFAEQAGLDCDCDSEHLPAEIEGTLRSVGMGGDLHEGNIIYSNGIYYLIDLEC